jgi:hypothetical protein
MCKKCDVLKELFKAVNSNSHENYIPTLAFMKEMENQGRVSLLAGDCHLEEVEKLLYEETHYTICHYFECNSCNQYFFIGACIRGTPTYKTMKSLSNVNFDNMLWGHIGTMFEKTKGNTK